MTGRILVVNTGSSSVKFSLYDAGADDLAAEAHGELEGIGVRLGREVVGSRVVQRELDARGTGVDDQDSTRHAAAPRDCQWQ